MRATSAGVWALTLLLGLAAAGNGYAQIYHYVDERGRKVYVDSLSQIPAQYRDQVEQLREPAPQRTMPLPAPGPEQQLQALRTELERMLAQVDAALKELQTPVEIRDNRVLVPVRAVYGNRHADTRMLLDTGASGTVFHRDAIAPLRGATYAAGQARVASGERIEVHAINLDRIEIGPYRIKATRAMVLDHSGRSEHDGLLGMDFLRQVQYRIDYDNGMIIWDPAQYQALQTQREELLRAREMDLGALQEQARGRQAPQERVASPAP